MRFIHFYLIGYFILVSAAAMALWQGGVLERISGLSLAITAIVVFGVGVLLALTSGRSTTVSRE